MTTLFVLALIIIIGLTLGHWASRPADLTPSPALQGDNDGDIIPCSCCQGVGTILMGDVFCECPKCEEEAARHDEYLDWLAEGRYESFAREPAEVEIWTPDLGAAEVGRYNYYIGTLLGRQS